jgi:hypothetical protein
MRDTDHGNWHVHARLFKFKGDWQDRATAILAGIQPYEILEGKDNVLLNVGINLLEQLLIGGAGTPYSNSNARMGVGTGTGPAQATDTDITNGVWMPMASSYPQQANQILTFEASWGAAYANQAWNEWAIDNGSSAHILLNHKIQSYGTKPSGETWVLQVTVTIS